MSNTLHQQREQQAIDLFEREGIIVSDDHFVYKAGGHGDAYVQKDKTLVDPQTFVEVTEMMSQYIEEEVAPEEIDYLVGFAPCSSQYASRMAERLTASTKLHVVRSVFMEKNLQLESMLKAIRSYIRNLNLNEVLVIY